MELNKIIESIKDNKIKTAVRKELGGVVTLGRFNMIIHFLKMIRTSNEG